MSRGGARPGAGRPAPDGRRVTIGAMVKVDTKKRLSSWAKETGMSVGKMIDFVVEDYERLAKSE